MTLSNFISIFIFVALVTLISCEDKRSLKQVAILESDTTKIITLLLDSAFYRHNLPDITALTKNNPFGDSIIFRNEIYQSDTNIERYFPYGHH